MAEVFSGIIWFEVIGIMTTIKKKDKTNKNIINILAFPVNGGVYSWCYLLSSEEWGPCKS